MNRTFRLVWNDTAKSLTIAQGWVEGRNRGLSVRAAALAAAALSGLLVAGPAIAGGPAATALPTGAQVTAGQAAITTSGASMSVVQTSAKAIVNWQSFNIGSDAAVTFSQPGANAVALNRVVGSDPSAIYGRLTANGQVFLVNPNGVLFAPTARVDVGGLVAGTLDIRDQDFLAGTYRFSRNGSTGAVANQGELTGGYVALLGSQVSNEGVISAPMGTVALAAGEAVTLGVTGQELVSVQVDKASLDTLVQNKGLIQVDGGTALLSAQSANALLGQVVNTGQIAADGIEADGGTIRLTASSLIDHSGVLSADAGANGKGGTVSVIAALDNPASLTRVSGAISAKGGARSGDGGSVETSASRLKIADSARVDTTASNGSTGAWLLDPYDFTIAAANGDITGSALSTALATSDVRIATTDTGVSCTVVTCDTGDSSGHGDIFVNDAVSWSSGHTLTLSAWNGVNINAPVTVSGTGGLALELAQYDVTANFPFARYAVNAPVNLAAGAHFSVKMGSDGPVTPYTVITDAAGLAAVASDLTGGYVLGSDVDISAIASWTPLGTMSTPFAGDFDGLGHKVTGLTHPNASNDTEVGLFGATRFAEIRNLGVVGANVAGSQNVGALVGFSDGAVINSYATGSVTGSGSSISTKVGGIGGLVGYSGGTIETSYADVTVSATSGDQSSGSPLQTFGGARSVGGIGGLTGGVNLAVTSSYALGAVTGNNAVGGLVGYSAGAIDSTYSVGLVTGATVNAVTATNVGGLIGQVLDPTNNTPFIFNSVWNATTSGQSTSAHGVGDAANVVGLTTTQMQTASTYTGNWITYDAFELRNGYYPLLKQMLQPIFVTANDKTTTYNGAPVTGFVSTVAPSGLGANYTGTVTVTPSTLNPTNAGSYTLTASGLTLTSPGDQHGYRLQYVAGVLTINAAPITTTITGSLTGSFSKTYDGTTAANGLTASNFLLTGWQGADGATVTKTSGVFDNANAGTGKNITVTLTSGDFTATGSTDFSNYILPTSVQGSIGTINKAPLNVTVAKTYDGTASFSTGFNFTGMVHGDAAPTVTSGSATTSSANAATYASFATNTLALSNANYTLTGGAVSATINPALLTITGSLTGSFSKTYDGTSTASGLTASNFLLTGWAGSDGATVTKTSGVFDDANAGSGKTITVTLASSDFTATGSTNLSNYILPTSVQGAIGTINQAALNVTVAKTYDGSAGFSSGFSLSGQLADDAPVTVTSGSASVSSANASTYASFTTNDLRLSNPNYTLVGGKVSAKITPKALDVLSLSNLVSQNGSGPVTTGGTVSGSVTSTLTPGSNGILSTDGPLTLSGSGTWQVGAVTESKRSGLWLEETYSVTAEGQAFKLSGKGAGNYTLTGTSVSAKIRPSVYYDTAANLAKNAQQNAAIASSQTSTIINSAATGGFTAGTGGFSAGGTGGFSSVGTGGVSSGGSSTRGSSGATSSFYGAGTVISSSLLGSSIVTTTGNSLAQNQAALGAAISSSTSPNMSSSSTFSNSLSNQNVVISDNGGVVLINDNSQPIQYRDNPPDNVLITMPSQQPVDRGSPIPNPGAQLNLATGTDASQVPPVSAGPPSPNGTDTPETPAATADNPSPPPSTSPDLSIPDAGETAGRTRPPPPVVEDVERAIEAGSRR